MCERGDVCGCALQKYGLSTSRPRRCSASRAACTLLTAPSRRSTRLDSSFTIAISVSVEHSLEVPSVSRTVRRTARRVRDW